MNKVRLLATSASVVAFGLSASARAETTGAAQPAPPEASAQQAPSSQDKDNSAVIVVTGIRGSLQRAQEIKRRAATVVEAITTQDLGKFSDASIADALQRVPGVQISRNDDGDSGDRVTIRGLGSQYVNTTINGREAISYGDYGANLRSFNFDSVPSEILTGVRIYKTAAAELIEPGLAGEVELQTLRPLDYSARGNPNVFGALSARGDYDDARKRWSPRLSGFLGSKLGHGTLGVYAAFTLANNARRQDENQAWNVTRDIRLQDTAGGPVRTIAGASVPDEWNIRTQEFTRKRRTLATGLQWRPDDHWDVNADFEYNKYGISGTADNLRIIPGEPGVYTGIFQPGGIRLNAHNQVIALDTSKVVFDDPTTAPSDSNPFPSLLVTNELRDNRSKTYQGGLNVQWKNDGWTVKADYYRQSVEAINSFKEFYTYSDLIPIQYDGTQAGQAHYALGGNYLDQASYRCVYSAGFPANPSPACYFQQAIQFKASRQSGKLDLSREFSPNFTLKIGSRIQHTTVDSRAGQDFSELSPDRFARFRSVFFTGRTRDTFPGIGITSVPLTDSQAGCIVYPDLCGKDNFFKGSFGGSFPDSLNNPNDVLGSLSGSSFRYIQERNIGIYAQGDLRGSVGGIPFESNAGLRAVNIYLKTRGFISQVLIDNPTNGSIQASADSPIVVKNSYWEYLPSFNLNLHPANSINLRLGVARVMSLPQYEDTQPNSSVMYAQNPQGLPGSATSGNPLIKPITSWNYDLTAELYTRSKGAFVASAFYKDAKNFILSDTVNNAQLPGFVPSFPAYASPTSRFNIAQPVNFSDGYAYGFEIGASQPFSFLAAPWNGFGIQANYTYVMSKFTKNDPRITFGFPGSSKHNVNLIAYYEKYGFSARVAYTYRSAYFNAFGDGGGYRTAFAGFTRGEKQVDASVSYALTPKIDVSVSGSNLTRTTRSDYNISPDFFRASYTRPRVISVGIRASL